MKDWFEPAKLFQDGYPDQLTSALRALPKIREAVRAEVAALKARRVLEIGPGDTPVAVGEQVTYLDVAPVFLRRLSGLRVVGDLFAAPFRDGTFDLVVASDVLTHVPAERRAAAMAAIGALAPAVIVFNPEPGTSEVEGSRSPTAPIIAFYEQTGWRVRSRTFSATTVKGAYVMRLVVATRR